MNIDQLFRQAVALIGAGEVPALERLLTDHPELARERLAAPGPWLRDKIGGALDGFFKHPYLLWFVAEDVPVLGRLPKNIADVARAIIRAGRHNGVPSLQEQLDYALRLVTWSGVAHQCGVQIELLGVLVEAGASPDGASDSALVNGHLAAAEHLVRRGAKLTLATALCLGRWDDVSRLAAAASDPEKRMGFVLAALNGRPTRCGG
jgi:peptide-methionine (S)-S-oxide reductase